MFVLPIVASAYTFVMCKIKYILTYLLTCGQYDTLHMTIKKQHVDLLLTDALVEKSFESRNRME